MAEFTNGGTKTLEWIRVWTHTHGQQPQHLQYENVSVNINKLQLKQ